MNIKSTNPNKPGKKKISMTAEDALRRQAELGKTDLKKREKALKPVESNGNISKNQGQFEEEKNPAQEIIDISNVINGVVSKYRKDCGFSDEKYPCYDEILIQDTVRELNNLKRKIKRGHVIDELHYLFHENIPYARLSAESKQIVDALKNAYNTAVAKYVVKKVHESSVIAQTSSSSSAVKKSAAVVKDSQGSKIQPQPVNESHQPASQKKTSYIKKAVGLIKKAVDAASSKTSKKQTKPDTKSPKKVSPPESPKVVVVPGAPLIGRGTVGSAPLQSFVNRRPVPSPYRSVKTKEDGLRVGFEKEGKGDNLKSIPIDSQSFRIEYGIIYIVEQKGKKVGHISIEKVCEELIKATGETRQEVTDSVKTIYEKIRDKRKLSYIEYERLNTILEVYTKIEEDTIKQMDDAALKAFRKTTVKGSTSGSRIPSGYSGSSYYDKLRVGFHKGATETQVRNVEPGTKSTKKITAALPVQNSKTSGTYTPRETKIKNATQSQKPAVAVTPRLRETKTKELPLIQKAKTKDALTPRETKVKNVTQVQPPKKSSITSKGSSTSPAPPNIGEKYVVKKVKLEGYGQKIPDVLPKKKQKSQKSQKKFWFF